MQTSWAWFEASIVAVIIGTASVGVAQTANADAGKPLVVAVEMGPGAGADVRQVRDVIARELGRRIVPFVENDAAPSAGTDEPDLLLVGLGRERIVMSLRRRVEANVARSVPAPSDGAARLRTIAWLAGNVVRDQISPFLRASAELGKGDPQVAAVSSEVAPSASAPLATTEPPPIAPPPLPSGAAAETLVREAPPGPQRTEAEWSVTVSGGPAVYSADRTLTYDRSVAFQVELIKHRPDRWIWGVGADLGPFGAINAGLAVLGGSEWRWGKTRLEANAGLGIAGMDVSDAQTTMPAPDVSETRVTRSTVYGPYIRGFMTLSRELTPSWDLVLRVGVNSTYALPAVSSGLGLRLNLM